MANCSMSAPNALESGRGEGESLLDLLDDPFSVLALALRYLVLMYKVASPCLST
jgi:hypothetical protein